MTLRSSAAVGDRFAEGFGVPADFAYGATTALAAATRRAGRLVAERRLPRAAAERLVLAMVERANRDLAGRPR